MFVTFSLERQIPFVMSCHPSAYKWHGRCIQQTGICFHTSLDVFQKDVTVPDKVHRREKSSPKWILYAFLIYIHWAPSPSPWLCWRSCCWWAGNESLWGVEKKFISTCQKKSLWVGKQLFWGVHTWHTGKLSYCWRRACLTSLAASCCSTQDHFSKVLVWPRNRPHIVLYVLSWGLWFLFPDQSRP